MGPPKKNDKILKKKKIRLDRIKEIGKDEYKRETYKGRYLKKRALIDQQLLVNDKRDFSYAQRKWLWMGEDGGGIFEKDDLQDWYINVDQTEVKPTCKHIVGT